MDRTRLSFKRLSLVFFSVGLLSNLACAQEELDVTLPIETENAFPNLSFTRPVYFVSAPENSDRVFVVEQGGRIVYFENRSDVGEDDVHVFIDLTDKVRSPVSDVSGNRGGNEEGLIGFAFHPDFENNREVFLHYSATNPSGAEDNQRGVLSRFTAGENLERLDRDSEEVLLEVGQFAGNHNGGMLDFGPDGYLYMALGDGGGGGDPRKHGQNLSTLLATILRIDIDNTNGDRPYAIPSDNPFVDRDDARDEIFAYGLRNPWRFSFDRKTGDIWAGDVCQNLWEKVFVVRKGYNYGWPFLEGTHEYDGIPEGVDPDSLTPPIIEHPRSEMRSITGGYVYRGESFPELEGAYVYGDYVTGNMYALHYDFDNREIANHEPVGRVREISSFGEDREGELYIVSLDGEIHRFIRSE